MVYKLQRLLAIGMFKVVWIGNKLVDIEQLLKCLSIFNTRAYIE